MISLTVRDEHLLSVLWACFLKFDSTFLWKVLIPYFCSCIINGLLHNFHAMIFKEWFQSLAFQLYIFQGWFCLFVNTFGFWLTSFKTSHLGRKITYKRKTAYSSCKKNYIILLRLETKCTERRSTVMNSYELKSQDERAELSLRAWGDVYITRNSLYYLPHRNFQYWCLLKDK